MIQFINRIIRQKYFRGFKGASNPQLSSRGQVAIILLLAAALGLIFFAIVFNIGKVSQYKTLTIVAANGSASFLGSMMASYGEQIFQTQLGGETKVCGWTGILGAIIAIIVAIIAIILAPFTAGQSLHLLYVAMAVIGAIAAIAALVIQLTVVQPAITAFWEKMILASLSIQNQFVERGVLRAIQGLVTDQVKVPDYIDVDGDGFFGFPTVPGDIDTAVDTVSRFGYLNTERLRRIPKANIDPIIEFQESLRAFVYRPADINHPEYTAFDDWGLHDPIDCDLYVPGDHVCCPLNPVTSLDFPSVCDPCCDPIALRRPACCTDPMHPSPCVNLKSCATRSFFNNGAFSADFIYNVHTENWENNFAPTNHPSGDLWFSFREQLGEDDNNARYTVDRLHPMGITPFNQIYTGNLTPDPPPTDTWFKLEDATGYYRPPPSAASWGWVPPLVELDQRVGIFPFMYKVADWGLVMDPAFTDYSGVQCHWCVVGVGFPCPVNTPDELITDRLVLSRPPDAGNRNGGWCVDVVHSQGIGDPPQISDLVPEVPGLITPMNPLPGQCGSTFGGWRRGADRYCDPAPDWPYNVDCEVHSGNNPNGKCTEPPPDSVDVDCECEDFPGMGGTDEGVYNPTFFNVDNLDEVIYGLDEFFDWAVNFVNTDPLIIAQNFDLYYDEAADWIEPGCPANFGPNNGLCGGGCPPCPWSFTDEERDGSLFYWRAELINFRTSVNAWLTPFAEGLPDYSSTSCMIPPNPDTSVWCLPPGLQPFNNYGIPECGCVTPAVIPLGIGNGEESTFDVSGRRGQLQDVVECLKWNAGLDGVGTYTYSDALVAEGNDQKFDACYNACIAGEGPPLINEKCEYLPRSLVPNFCNDFMPFDAGDVAEFNECLASADFPTCAIECAPSEFPAACPVGGPPFLPPNLAQIANIDAIQAQCDAGAIPTWGTTSCCPPVPFGQVRTCPDPLSPQIFDDCRCACGNDCTFILEQNGNCTPGGGNFPPGGDPTYYNEILLAMAACTGSCGDPVFLAALDDSRIIAQNQVDKFAKRARFLEARMNEGINMLNVLDGGIAAFDQFLDNDTPWGTPPAGGPPPPPAPPEDSPVENFIWARINLFDEISPKTWSVLVYVWQDLPLDEPRAGSDPPDYEGYWHAVKVEVRIPKRCNSLCNSTGSGPTDWPDIDTYTKSWGTRRCFELVNRTGRVKARVIRFDENPAPKGLTFTDGTPVWDIQYTHPEVGKGNPANVMGACGFLADDRFILGVDPWANAFFLDKPPNVFASGGPDGDYWDCWEHVHVGMLQYGVETISCVNYFFGDAGQVQGDPWGTRGFRLRFVECDDLFADGFL